MRVCHRRRVIDHPQRYLIEAVQNHPVGTLETELPATNNRAARKTKLSLYVLAAKVPLPANHPRRELDPVDLNWVLAREENPPDETERVEWLLATTLKTDSREEAIACVQRYRLRWRIERYFYALKQGCQVEKLQLQSADHLMRALATYAIVAWRITHLLYHAKTYPHADSREHLSPLESLVLRLGTLPTISPADGPLSNAEALRLLGQIGGHNGRTRDGPPGVKCLWRGLQRLNERVTGFSIALIAPQLVGKG